MNPSTISVPPPHKNSAKPYLLGAYFAGMLGILAASLPTGLLAQAQVDGPGYISLRAPTVPWAPGADTDNVNRFIWLPATNTLLIGSRSIVAPSIYAPNSFAFGPGSSAGEGGFAFGSNAVAGPNSTPNLPPGASRPNFAFGHGATATQSSIAFGSLSVADFLSTAMGHWALASTASSSFGLSAKASFSSTALGNSTHASISSVAVGNSAIAGAVNIGEVTAIGANSKGLGLRSTALGRSAFAVTDYSTAVGGLSTTNAIGQMAFGRYNPPQKRGNTGFPAVNVAAPTDPVFVVGPGTLANGNLPTPTPPNVLTIYRDGQVHLSGVVRVPRAGDIGMGSFNSGLNPETGLMQ